MERRKTKNKMTRGVQQLHLSRGRRKGGKGKKEAGGDQRSRNFFHLKGIRKGRVKREEFNAMSNLAVSEG